MQRPKPICLSECWCLQARNGLQIQVQTCQRWDALCRGAHTCSLQLSEHSLGSVWDADLTSVPKTELILTVPKAVSFPGYPPLNWYPPVQVQAREKSCFAFELGEVVRGGQKSSSWTDCVWLFCLQGWSRGLKSPGFLQSGFACWFQPCPSKQYPGQENKMQISNKPETLSVGSSFPNH